LNDALFRRLAERFPTHRMGEYPLLASLWRFAFYTLRPSAPFVMRTRDYRLTAYPGRKNLTHAVIRRGYWEPGCTEAFRSLLRPGALVVDAGANFGHYALTAASVVGKEGLVYAFEPHPGTFALLEQNCALQGRNNLVAVQAGLAARDGEMDIYTDSGNHGGHSFFDWNLRGEVGGSDRVPTHALDSFLAGHAPGRRLDAMKIDVQGYEMEVLRGAALTISRDRPAVLCEVTPAALRAAGSGTDELVSFFAALGYRAEVLADTPGGALTLDLASLADFLAATTAEYHDVLFRPD
jgi:FkbM family methyltransferase